MPELRKEIKLGVDKRLMYINHPAADCLEIDIEIKSFRGDWITRTSFSLKYEDLQKLVEETKTKPTPV